MSNRSKFYSKRYSKKSFWEKAKNFAIAAGKSVMEKALILYYCSRDPDTPAWAKTVIFGALGYFIVPLDSLPDLTPGVGYADDFGFLASAFATVAVHIKDKHKQQAKKQLKIWFN